MAERFWVGGVDADPTDINNWSDTTLGAGPASSVPVAGDKAIFDNTGVGNCTIASAITWGQIQVKGAFSSLLTINVSQTLSIVDASVVNEVNDELTNNGTLKFSGAGSTVEPRGVDETLAGIVHIADSLTLKDDGGVLNFTGTLLVEGGKTLTIVGTGVTVLGSGTVAQTGTGDAIIDESVSTDRLTWDSDTDLHSTGIQWDVSVQLVYKDATTRHVAAGFVANNTLYLAHDGAIGTYQIVFDGNVSMGTNNIVPEYNTTSGTSITTTTFSAAGTVTAGDIAPVATTAGVLEHIIDLGAGTIDLSGAFNLAAAGMNGNTIRVDWGTCDLQIATNIDVTAISDTTAFATGSVTMDGTGTMTDGGAGAVTPVVTLSGAGTIGLATNYTVFGLDASGFTGSIDFQSTSRQFFIAGTNVTLGTGWTPINNANLDAGLRFNPHAVTNTTRTLNVDGLGGTSPTINRLTTNTSDTVEIEDVIELFRIHNRATSSLAEHANGGNILFTATAGTKEFQGLAGRTFTVSVPIDLNLQTVFVDLVSTTTTFSQVDNGTFEIGDPTPAAGAVHLAAAYSGTADIVTYGDLKLLGAATIGDYSHADAAATLDLNGKALTLTDLTVGQGEIINLAGGTISGSNLSFGVQIAGAAAWTTTATVSLEAINGILVANSDASGGVQGDGTLAVNGSGNINWGFGGVKAPGEAPPLGLGLGLGVQVGRTHPQEAM